MKTIGPKETAARALRVARATRKQKIADYRADPVAVIDYVGRDNLAPRPFMRPILEKLIGSKKKPAPPAQPKEPQMKTKKVTSAAKRGSAARKADKAKKARKPGKAPAPAAAALPVSGKRPDGLRVGSKEARMLDLVLQAAPTGITEAAICKELGWKRCRVTLGRVCEKAKAELTSTGQGAERKWSATMPDAKAA